MANKKNKTIATAKRLVNALDKSMPIHHAYLFGSHAKGTSNPWSDIDLAIFSDAFKGIRFYDHKMLIPFLREYPSSIEIHPFKNKDFDREDLFIQEILKTGIKIK